MAEKTDTDRVVDAITRLAIEVAGLNPDPHKTIAEYRAEQERRDRWLLWAAVGSVVTAAATILTAIGVFASWLRPLAR